MSRIQLEDLNFGDLWGLWGRSRRRILGLKDRDWDEEKKVRRTRGRCYFVNGKWFVLCRRDRLSETGPTKNSVDVSRTGLVRGT